MPTVKDSRKIDEVSISETSDGDFTLHIWKESGYSDTYVLPEDQAKFLWNRLGGELRSD